MSEQPSILWRLVAILLVVFLLSPIVLLVVFSFTSRGLTNFPIESIWTDFSSLVDAWFGVLAEFPSEVQADILGRTARRVYRLTEEVQG